MANRLLHKRRKCVKSPNIFRDKQEYSSLYTISSRSASSLHSSEMASQIGKQGNQGRAYKVQHQKGDAPQPAQPQAYVKYRKLPTELSQELQQKVYASCCKSYYNDRTQFIKSKFNSLTLEHGQQCTKQNCPAYSLPSQEYMTSDHRSAAKPPVNQRCVGNTLEESYWASWKPHKCDDINAWRNYMQQMACGRKPCCPMPPSGEYPCVKPQSKKKIKCCHKESVKVIRPPTDMRDSNSSEAVLSQREDEKKVQTFYSLDEEDTTKSSMSVDDASDEKHVKFQSKAVITTIESADTGDSLDTSQEEYENLYNEMYTEYETELLNKISEYEMQREAEEMQELERHLTEQREALRAAEEMKAKAEARALAEEAAKAEAQRRALAEQAAKAEEAQKRALAEQAKAEVQRRALAEQAARAEAQRRKNAVHAEAEEIVPKLLEDIQNKAVTTALDKEDGVLESDEQNKTSENELEYSEPEIAILKHTDSFIITSRRQKEERPRKPQPKFLKLTKLPFTAAPPVKGHTYPLKSAMKKERSPSQTVYGYNRPVSPVTPKARATTKHFQPAYLLRH